MVVYVDSIVITKDDHFEGTYTRNSRQGILYEKKRR